MTYDREAWLRGENGTTFDGISGFTKERGNTMSAHTPGPWKFRRVNNVDHYRCVPTDTQDRELLKAVPIDRISEVEANARLIAAAPAMLEALQHLMTAFRVMRDRHATQWDLSVTPDLCTAWDEAKKAIRLAEGRG